MESETVIIKSEPTEDGYEDAYHLQNGQIQNGKTCLQNGHVDQIPYTSATNEEEQNSIGNKNFSCLLCDVICDNRDDLRKHLKTDHKSKSSLFNQGSDQRAEFYSSYLHFRYTCNLCGAKFKTFKNYFSHSMSHKGYGALQSSFSDAVMRSGKEVLKNYFDTEDGFQGSFRCDECKTVFMQRDSYAMHMMMRAMNETCQPTEVPEFDTKTKLEPNEDESGTPKAQNDYMITEVATTSEMKQADNDAADTVSNESPKCLEDVTCKVDQDEYLKSVLDKVVVQNDVQAVGHGDKYNDVSKPCIFCGQAFTDQDSLAMHVMSVHADQMTFVSPSRNNVASSSREYFQWMSPHLFPLDCKYCGKKFVSRDNLAMHVLTHAHQDAFNGTHDVNSFANKRKFDQINISSGPTSSKIAKSLTHFNSYEPSKQIAANNLLTTFDLYCNLCSLQFYSKGDFDWHVRCRHNASETENEPLCLAKQEKHSASEDQNTDKPNPEGNVEKRTRRNSFSVDENSRHHYVIPKRPISADMVTHSIADRRHSLDVKVGVPTKLSEAGEIKSKDLKIKKEIQRSMAIACVDALSSNEKRIIYSVFGNELIKKNENNSATEETKVITDKFDNQEKMVKSLPQEHVSQHYKPITRETDSAKTSPTSAADLKEDLENVLKGKDAAMCRYCEIIFLNKAIYYLHMGLHNVNNHWQCNVCGKICKSAVDFAAHIIHM